MRFDSGRRTGTSQASLFRGSRANFDEVNVLSTMLRHRRRSALNKDANFTAQRLKIWPYSLETGKRLIKNAACLAVVLTSSDK